MKKRILVACNTLTAIGAGPYMDHTRLTYRLGRDFKQYDFMQMNARRLSIDRFRNMAARLAIDCGSEFLLFIDDDMHLEDKVFPLLISTIKKDNYDILAALAYVRGYPFDPMCYRFIEEPGIPRGLRAVDHKVIEEANGQPIDCDAIGTATCLIRTSLIKRVPPPWFITGPHNTEDIYFCMKAREYTGHTNIHNLKVPGPKYKPKGKPCRIGVHTGAITGHLLDPEVVNFYTRSKLRAYYESFMSQAEIDQINKKDHSLGYVEEVLKLANETNS